MVYLCIVYRCILMTEQLILQHIHEMPEHLRREVLDFIDALLTKHRAASAAAAKNIDPEGAKGYLSKEDLCDVL